MSTTSSLIKSYAAAAILLAGFLIASTILLNSVFADSNDSVTSVSVGNARPSVSATAISPDPITPNENTTTSVTITATISDGNGCDTVFTDGTITAVFYRSGVTATSSCTADDLNCYRNITLVEVNNTCTGSSDTAGDAVGTTSVWYFVDATDASSTYSAQNWVALVTATDSQSSSSLQIDGASSTVEINTTTALNVTATINYGSVAANDNTGATNQVATTTNTGNGAIDLEISGANLVSSGNSIDVGQQKYASSTLTYASLTYTLSTSPTVREWNIGVATASTTASASSTFWGLAVPNGQANGSYTGTTTFTAVFSP
ncbi:MAG: hypothetical protein HYT12_00315 [Candidatus Liptonbacteria bacterium]|nr:hypothetical protein [Candidatus Liptonbacteria bacterium]